jgi:hypothetical protein
MDLAGQILSQYHPSPILTTVYTASTLWRQPSLFITLCSHFLLGIPGAFPHQYFLVMRCHKSLIHCQLLHTSFVQTFSWSLCFHTLITYVAAPVTLTPAPGPIHPVQWVIWGGRTTHSVRLHGVMFIQAQGHFSLTCNFLIPGEWLFIYRKCERLI